MKASGASLLHPGPETGMRKGELAGLKWTDIDFEAGTVTVAAPC